MFVSESEASRQYCCRGNMSNICDKTPETYLPGLAEQCTHMDEDVIANNANVCIRWVFAFPFPGKSALFCPLMAPGGAVLQA